LDGSDEGEDRNIKSDVGTCGRIWGRRPLVAQPLSLLIGLASGSWSGNVVYPGGCWCSIVDEHTPSGAFSMNGPLEEGLAFDVVASLVLAGALALGALGALFAFVTGVGFRRGGSSSMGMAFLRAL